jgi:tetratricopeptide (TPR) repeat protein
MSFKKALKAFLSPAINIFVGIILLRVFFIAGQNIAGTFAVADMTALSNLRPYPLDYFWELNIHQAPLDRNKVRLYADYYEHLLQVFPGLRETYGLLGYCYHYLNDDPKAIKYLKIAIRSYPDYFWNYYDLAVIYIDQSRYQEAAGLLQKALEVNPAASLRRMVSSPWVYWPLLGTNNKEIFVSSAQHLKAVYQTSFILEQIFKHIEDKKKVQEVISQLHPEVYAF